jgi:hypothetical protein
VVVVVWMYTMVCCWKQQHMEEWRLEHHHHQHHLQQQQQGCQAPPAAVAPGVYMTQRGHRHPGPLAAHQDTQPPVPWQQPSVAGLHQVKDAGEAAAADSTASGYVTLGGRRVALDQLPALRAAVRVLL